MSTQRTASLAGPHPVPLGAAIRARRRELGLTLVEVGDLSGLSHPFLSQVERGLARLSLASLQRLCRALGTSEVELFWGAEVPSATDVVRGGTSRGRYGRFGHARARVLVRGRTAFVPLEVRGANRAAGEYHRHAEDEFVHVVEGHVVTDVGAALHRLGPGDSLYLDGGTPHRWYSPDGSAYRLLVVKQRLPHPSSGTEEG